VSSGISPGVVSAQDKPKTPLGITEEQFQALVAGAIAVAVFSKHGPEQARRFHSQVPG